MKLVDRPKQKEETRKSSGNKTGNRSLSRAHVKLMASILEEPEEVVLAVLLSRKALKIGAA